MGVEFVMADKHEPGMAYNTGKLNKVFFFLSLGLLVTVLWMFLADYIRPWKAIQLEAMKIKRLKIEQKISKTESSIDKERYAALEGDLKEAEKIVQSREKEIKAVSRRIDDYGVQIKAETIVNGRLNSEVSAMAFKWEQAHSHHKPSAPRLFRKLQDLKKSFASSKDRMKALQAASKKKTRELDKLKSEVTKVQKSISETVKTLELLKVSKKKSELGPVFALRNAPFFDFMNPTLKIHQVVAKNITDDRYFQHVPKVDRCMTCHTFIDKTGYEDLPNPFKTHPNLELMVGAKSPHPMKEYGCTSCHGGEGHRVLDFNAAAHTPRDKEQEKEWIEKYNWHAPHKVPQVMFKVGHTEAGCIKCHGDVEFIPKAEVVNEGRRNMEKFGCYACHKIKGWEDKRSAGPSLERVASKVSKEFFKNWVWAPKSFNKHAMMPSFFGQSNNKREDFMRKNITEVNAIAEFVWSKSEAYKPFSKYTGGSKSKGKKLIKTVGCMGCHGVEGLESESNKVGSYAGPYLSATGSKIKDPDWLVSWLKRPSHYQRDTIMPSFRLSDKEANDIAAYLLSLKNKSFDSLVFEPIDKKVRDELLVEYLSAFDTVKVAGEKLAKMSDRDRTLELGHRSIGKYGCYSCHSIKGFEGRTPIGADLSFIGSKPITQFGFGHEYDVPHSRDGWIKAHLINPRRWDSGVDRAFKDILRMPNFYMTEEEAESITVALSGQVSDYVPLAGRKRLNAHETIANKGMKIMNKYNCVGCHKIDGERGDITAMYEDDLNEGPPWLVGQGHRTHSDWLHNFLGNVKPIRPWLGIRMPSFNLTNEEINSIVAAFQMKEKQHSFRDKKEKLVWLPGERRAAKKLFNEFACTSCHTGGFSRDEATAPDLHLSHKRLRSSWIEKWLSNPQAILDYTTMTNFWEDGESMAPDILGGDRERQVKALTKYVLELGMSKKGRKK